MHLGRFEQMERDGQVSARVPCVYLHEQDVWYAF